MTINHECLPYFVFVAEKKNQFYSHAEPVSDGLPTFSAPKRLQLLLLNPLKELSNVLHADIRQKQLESVLQILQSQGDGLGPGWPLVLGVIGAIRNDQG